LARLGDQPAREQALALAAGKSGAVQLRVAMVQLLAELAQPSSVGTLLAMISPREPEPVQLAAVGALQAFPNAELDGLLASYPTMSPRVRSKTREVFLSRKSWALEFLSAIDSGKISPAEVAVEELRNVALLQDRQLDDLVRKHW